jgi:hypothetical protein
MQLLAASETRIPNAFGSLPVELFLTVLDQLVSTRDGWLPIAYEPSHAVTKALRALTLVSRTAYLCASRYLYTNCLYLNDIARYSHFRRTLGLHLGNHPLALETCPAVRNEELFRNIQQHVVSMFISPFRTDSCGRTPRVRLPQVVDLCLTVGPTLKRLAIDFNPVYVPASEQVLITPSSRSIFLHMPHLEDLICSYDTLDYFRYPPPNLKRLAVTANDMDPCHLDFYFMVSSLETLFLLRPKTLEAKHINELFNRYNGMHIDIVFVDVNSNHFTPDYTRDWTSEDRVTIWEIDVATSFYGDEEDLVLCDSWIWTHGVKGDLWNQDKRRMRSWSEIEGSLAEPAAL